MIAALLLLAATSTGPLQVELVGGAHLDGRTLLQAKVLAAPPPLEGEELEHPAQLVLECEGAIPLPGGDLLLPARASAPTSLSCRARLRGEETLLEVPVTPPGPGLHAEFGTLQASPGDTISLRPFAVGEEGAVLEHAEIRVGTSVGALEVDEAGALRLVTQKSRAPQVLVLALAGPEGAGAAFLPLRGRTHLPVVTTRKATVTVRIAGRPFGPLETRSGRATFEIEVPPGVTVGTLRVTDRFGNARERPVNLDTPDRPRLAAVLSTDTVPIGETLEVVVALADPRGRPLLEAPGLEIQAQAGALSPPEFLGPGLWTARYRAPENLGPDAIRVRVEGAEGLGEATLSLSVRVGEPASLILDRPLASYLPGETATLKVRVEDAVGNRLPEAPFEAELEGPGSVEVAPGSGTVSVTLPRQIPAGPVELRVKSGRAEARASLSLTPGPAATGTLELVGEGRQALARLEVVDAFGNQVGEEAYSLERRGWALAPPQPEDAPGWLRLEGDPGAMGGLLILRGPTGELARVETEFPDPSPWRLGLTASIAFASNLGSLRTGVPALGLRAGRNLEWAELTLSAELGLLWHRAELPVETPAGPGSVVQRVLALDLPLLVGGRVAVSPRMGLFAELGPVFLPTTRRLLPDFQPETVERSLVFGFRAALGWELGLGPGRFRITAAFGRAALPEGPVQGQLDGLRLGVGYQLWLKGPSRPEDRRSHSPPAGLLSDS